MSSGDKFSNTINKKPYTQSIKRKKKRKKLVKESLYEKL
jgi:hypothetical protein